MQVLAQQPDKTVSRRVTMQGREFLVGLAYLPEIDWYEVTLLDVNQLLPLRSFAGLLVVFVLSLLVAMVAFNVLLGRVVLAPLNRLAQAIEQVQSEHFSPQNLPQPNAKRHDEMGHLMRLFYDMAHRVWVARHELEARVAERTAALEQSQETLRHLAQHDTLTGLANRALFTDRLQQAMAAARRDGTELALLFLDLDHFKPVNDAFGHAVGDVLLQEAAQRMLACVRDSDTVARIGGDEFVLLLRGADKLAQTAPEVAEKIRHSLCQPFTLAQHQVQISCSIGIALFPTQGTDDIELAHHADQAMYQAKQAGRNQVCLYQAPT
jgi:diguanylate cyclase (GGDEF)-like protein